jgi:hypothetical protein
MLQEDQRLQIIQAELDRCWDEIHFLGCFGGNVETDARDMKLLGVVNKINAIHISDNDMLEAVLGHVKSMLDGPISEITGMDFQDTASWTRLREILESLDQNLGLMQHTPAIGTLFSAIRDGIVEFIILTPEWYAIPNREAHFQNMLRKIGENMAARHSEFGSILPSNVSRDITEIENILKK